MPGSCRNQIEPAAPSHAQARWYMYCIDQSTTETSDVPHAASSLS